jgi:Asp-tRNA(Asn)/Glu-tRNA(Gln) amidotransferase A subunit family amidase
MLAEVAAAVRAGAVGASELVERALERIERLDGPVNAVIATFPERAAEAAAGLDARVAAGEDPGPLAGLPLLVKDNEDAEGERTTLGSLLRREVEPAVRDCEQIARLRAAGAIPIGRTNIPEFAFEGFTSNRLYGDTHNPWALDWTPGGSSGGSAAALAMGLVPLATATDGGGSVRIPAAFCGLAGLKPTNGVIGQWPPPSWLDLSTKGPLGTSIADVALLFDVLRGPIAGDPRAVPTWSTVEGAWPSRILAAPRAIAHGPLPSAVQASFDAALGALETAIGLPVEPVDPPLPPRADEDWYTLVAVEERTWVGPDLLDAREDELTPYVREANAFARGVSIEAYLAARRRRFEFVKVIDEFLGADAVFACPTMAVEGFYADGRSPGQEEEVTASAASDYNTQAANLTGHPALSVPAGVSANGVPFGLMVTAPRFRDDLALAVGSAWEAARPWSASAPGFEPFWP